MLETTLVDDSQRKAYQASDGGRGTREVASIAGYRSKSTIERLWKSWRKLGLRESFQVMGGGERFKRPFDLEDFGIEVPPVATPRLQFFNPCPHRALRQREETRVPEQTEKDILKSIQSLLEDQKNLFLVLNQDKLEEAKKTLLKPGTVESQVYDLCDGVNTTQVIAGKIQKSTDYTGAVLSSLRRKGLVKTFDQSGNKVHEKTF